MMINHLEKVDEVEQTLLVHGLLWATWTDEYMNWEPKDNGNVTKISIDAWKLWQPALSLYNSARGNSWHLYMQGMPAMVASNGRVWASGSFSFHVTCIFDFSRFPHDEQECPIVIADWVYDLSRVNLSDPQGETTWNKPTIRLNYDPAREGLEKKHSAGWELQDTWRRHCYWGPNGCTQDLPTGQAEWYWSLLEFGVKIKRHAPYFALTVVLPTLLTSMLTLVTFWVDTPSLTLSALVFNILLQGLFGWELIRTLPPGSVSLYGMNLSLTTIAFVFHVVSQFLISILPDDMEVPVNVIQISSQTHSQISSIGEKLKNTQFFKVKGLSFDPQLLLNGNVENGEAEESKEFHQASVSFFSASIFNETSPTMPAAEAPAAPAEAAPADEQIIELEEPTTNAATTTSAPSEQPASTPEEKKTEEHPMGTVATQLYLLRRVLFVLFFIMYLIAIPICLI